RLGLHEISLLIILCLAAGSIWLFVEIAGAVAEGGLEAFDRAILLGLRNPADLRDPLGPPWFEEMVRDVTALGGNLITLFITLAVAGYLALQRKGRAALFILLAVSSGILLGSLLKNTFERPRPDLVEHAMAVHSSS